MGDELEAARGRARKAYNAASDRYDSEANSFWSRFGQATVDRLQLKTGMHVLDVCCGSGASALPAARAVGREGRVIGIDLAEGMLALARAKAEQGQLPQAEFRLGDLLDPGVEEGSFDAVVCVFGIFFVPDMAAAVASLWRFVKPGGVLAITTWGPDLFEPGNRVFWESVRGLRPELYRSFQPWDRVCQADLLCEVMRQGGTHDPNAVTEAAQHSIAGPNDWWDLVLGSGYRGTVDLLSENELAVVREANLAFFSAANVASVRTDVVYGTARKPS